MKHIQHIALSLGLLLLAGTVRAEELLTYRDIKGWTPYFGGETDKTYLATSYEFSSIHLGYTHLDWNVVDVQIARPFQNATPYFDVAYFDRNHVGDYALTAGSYVKVGKDLLQVEGGYGLNVDFLYRFQGTVEYDYLLCHNLYWKLRGKYLRYDVGDVWIGSPAGLIYYFGDHYVTADYDFSSTEGRGTAQWGALKADFTMNKQFGFYVGAAGGERLFDMSELPASMEDGYIIFGGCRCRVLDGAQFTVGGSYSDEKPNFIKRSIDVSLSIRL